MDAKLPVFNRGETSKVRGQKSQGANKPGGERAKGRTSQGANQPGGERARGRTSQGRTAKGAKKPDIPKTRTL